MSARPTGKQWITIILLSLFVIGCAVSINHSLRDLRGSAPGKLAEQYTVKTLTSYGVIKKKSYKFNYTFVVQEKPYHGSDTLSLPPTSLNCTVYFDPSNRECRHCDHRRMSDRSHLHSGDILGSMEVYRSIRE